MKMMLWMKKMTLLELKMTEWHFKWNDEGIEDINDILIKWKKNLNGTLKMHWHYAMNNEMKFFCMTTMTFWPLWLKKWKKYGKNYDWRKDKEWHNENMNILNEWRTK